MTPPLTRSPDTGREELMTVKEAAEYLRMPVPTVYYCLQKGLLPGVLIGGRWRIHRNIMDTTILNPPTVILRFRDKELQEKVRRILMQRGGKRKISLDTEVKADQPNQTIITDKSVADEIRDIHSCRVIALLESPDNALDEENVSAGIPTTLLLKANIEDPEKGLRRHFKLDESLTSDKN